MEVNWSYIHAGLSSNQLFRFITSKKMFEFEADTLCILSSLPLTIWKIKSHEHTLEGSYNIFKIKCDKLGNDTTEVNH